MRLRSGRNAYDTGNMRIPSWREASTVYRVFRANHGRYPNLFRPRTYSELIQRRKLLDWSPIYTTLSDKIAVRDFVRERAGEGVLIPQQWTGDDASQIPFADLQYPIALKPNHLSGAIRIMHEVPTAHEATDIVAEAQRWLGLAHGYGVIEPGYYKVKPRLLVEDLLLEESGELPPDYKFHVFHGRACYLTMTTDRFREHYLAFYDREWNRLPIAMPPYPSPPFNADAPSCLREMVEVAEAIARGFDFLRVDLYAYKGRVYFGETTLYPLSGMNPYHPAEWETVIGEIWLKLRPATANLVGLVT